MNKFSSLFLEELRQKRILNKLSQKTIAEKIGITQSLYSRKESGDVEISLDEMAALSKLLHINLSTSEVDHNEESISSLATQLKEFEKRINSLENSSATSENKLLTELRSLNIPNVEETILFILKADRESFISFIKMYNFKPEKVSENTLKKMSR